MVAEGSEPHRHTWIDAMRLFAGVSMVGLHVTADAQGQPFPDVSAAERTVPMLIRAVLYTARTELFLMISILLLVMALDRAPRSYACVIRQQSRRLLVPFAFWTVFFACYGLLKAHALGYGTVEWARLMTWRGWVGFFLLGDVKYHMHFIPTLFGLLLIYPLYRAAQKAPIFGLLIVVFLLMKQQLDREIFALFWGSEWLPYVVRLVKIATYSGYGFVAFAIYGLWQRSDRETLESWLGPVALLAIGLFVFKLLATRDVIETGRWDFVNPTAYWADYLMPVALLVGCLCLSHRRWPVWISRASKYAFGIYLCHPIFLDVAEIALQGSSLSPTMLIMLEFIWTLPATVLFVWGLERTACLAWTVGLGPLPRLARVSPRQPI
nr:acyltransferase [Shimia sp. R10_1]